MQMIMILLTEVSRVFSLKLGSFFPVHADRPTFTFVTGEERGPEAGEYIDLTQIRSSRDTDDLNITWKRPG